MILIFLLRRVAAYRCVAPGLKTVVLYDSKTK